MTAQAAHSVNIILRDKFAVNAGGLDLMSRINHLHFAAEVLAAFLGRPALRPRSNGSVPTG